MDFRVSLIAAVGVLLCLSGPGHRSWLSSSWSAEARTVTIREQEDNNSGLRNARDDSQNSYGKWLRDLIGREIQYESTKGMGDSFPELTRIFYDTVRFLGAGLTEYQTELGFSGVIGGFNLNPSVVTDSQGLKVLADDEKPAKKSSKSNGPISASQMGSTSAVTAPYQVSNRLVDRVIESYIQFSGDELRAIPLSSKELVSVDVPIPGLDGARATVSLVNGTLSGIETLHRDGDATLVQFPDGSLGLNTRVCLDNIHTRYTVIVAPLHGWIERRFGVNLAIRRLSWEMTTFRDVFGKHYLKYFHLETLDGITLTTDSVLLSTIYDQLIDQLLQPFQGTIRSIIATRIRRQIKDAMEASRDEGDERGD